MEKKIRKAVNDQKIFFLTQKTKNIEYRKKMLKTLRRTIVLYQDQLADAVYKDLHKAGFEFFLTEVSLLLEELDYHIKKLKQWSSPKRVRSSLLHFKSKSYIQPEPLGQVLIVAPWNYPFHLMFIPLIGAISAGNTIILKPSPHSPNTSQVMQEMIAENFSPEYITLFQGDRNVNKILFDQNFDLIFYTGSPGAGKAVMEAAAKNLTPVILELGGKNPCVVDETANIKLAAKRITWGKFLNAGQTCTAPDYAFIHRNIKEEFILAMKETIQEFYGDDPKNSDFSRIINSHHTKRLSEMMKHGTIVAGGDFDIQEKYIAPTVIDHIIPDSPIIREEIFGPILPLMEYKELDDVIAFINNMQKPLGAYLFSENKRVQKEFITKTSSGGVTINDVIMHAVNLYLPFGGVGGSGMGNYHGEFSFSAFSHKKSILNKSTLIDIPLRYAPYTKTKQRIIKAFLKS